MRGLLTGSPGADEEAARIRAAARDSALLEWLYARHAAAVYGYLRHVLLDERAAEDVLQEVFVQLWRALPAYDPSLGSVRAWLMTMARSRAMDWLRRRAAERLRDAAALPDGAVGGAAAHGAGDDRHVWRLTLLEAIGQLPKEQRRALGAVYFAGLSQREAARRLAEPLGTVKGRLRLSLVRLRRILAGGGEGQ